MDKFKNAEQQLETCMTIFNPLDISIDTSEDTTITASLVCPKFAEDPANVKVVFDVYILDNKKLPTGYTIKKSPRGDIKVYQEKDYSFSYRLPIATKEVETLGGGGDTILKIVDKDTLRNGYKNLVSYLKNDINKNSNDNIEDYNITTKLEGVKLYALAYVVIDNKVKKGDEEVTIKSTRPDIAMHRYKLDQQNTTVYDDFMLEAVKDNIDSKLKDKVYFFKTFKEINSLKVEDILEGHSANPKPVPRSEDRFFVKIG